uniref:KRAB domain-containing protein n=1 Tax=Anolis carolinensis TaxID=28377 RepID=A0A803T472_ANOCA
GRAHKGHPVPAPCHVTFQEVAVSFSEEEWALLNPDQRALHQQVMKENFETLSSLSKNSPALLVTADLQLEHSRARASQFSASVPQFLRLALSPSLNLCSCPPTFRFPFLSSE